MNSFTGEHWTPGSCFECSKKKGLCHLLMKCKSFANAFLNLTCGSLIMQIHKALSQGSKCLRKVMFPFLEFGNLTKKVRYLNLHLGFLFFLQGKLGSQVKIFKTSFSQHICFSMWNQRLSLFVGQGLLLRTSVFQPSFLKDH